MRRNLRAPGTSISYTPRGIIGPDGPIAGSISLFEAIEKPGLKLDPAILPLPVIVVDSVSQKPTANMPNVAESLHVAPPPTEFEVAELKPTEPGFQGMRLQIQPGGRVNIAGRSVKFLIRQAWDLTEEMIAGAPKWMDTDRYNIVAKAGTAEMDIDELWPMLRALLVDRFQLKTHMEERPVTAYTLVAEKPKMKKADPASRTK
jgi:hypothetical protein